MGAPLGSPAHSRRPRPPSALLGSALEGGCGRVHVLCEPGGEETVRARNAPLRRVCEYLRRACGGLGLSFSLHPLGGRPHERACTPSALVFWPLSVALE